MIATSKKTFAGRWMAVVGTALAGVLFSAATAKANLVLTLTEVAGPHAGASDSANDPLDSHVTYTYFGFGGPASAVFGNDFDANIDIGFSNLGSATNEAILQVQTLNITSSSDGPGAFPIVLRVSLTDNGFTVPGAPGDTLSLASSAGATFAKSNAGDTVTFKSTISDSTPSSASTALQTFVSPGGDPTVFGIGPGNASTTFVRSTSYTLSNVTELTFTRPSEQINANGTTTTLAVVNNVPEPTSALLAMVGSSALLIRRRRRA